MLFPKIFKRKKVLSALALAIVAAAVMLFPAGCGKATPGSVPELLNQSFIDAREGYWGRALRYATLAAKREPANISALLLKSFACEHSGKTELAIASAREAVNLEPENFLAQYTLGRLYAKDPGKIQDAIAPLLRAHKLMPNNLNALVLLAGCSAKLNLDSAIKYYSRLAEIQKFSNKPEVWNQMGVFYAGKNNLPEAARCFVNAYNLAPENHVVLLNLAIFMDYYAKQSARAVKFYMKYMEITAGNQELKKKRGGIKKRMNAILGNQPAQES